MRLRSGSSGRRSRSLSSGGRRRRCWCSRGRRSNGSCGRWDCRRLGRWRRLRLCSGSSGWRSRRRRRRCSRLRLNGGWSCGRRGRRGLGRRRNGHQRRNRNRRRRLNGGGCGLRRWSGCRRGRSRGRGNGGIAPVAGGGAGRCGIIGFRVAEGGVLAGGLFRGGAARVGARMDGADQEDDPGQKTKDSKQEHVGKAGWTGREDVRGGLPLGPDEDPPTACQPGPQQELQNTEQHLRHPKMGRPPSVHCGPVPSRRLSGFPATPEPQTRSRFPASGLYGIRFPKGGAQRVGPGGQNPGQDRPGAELHEHRRPGQHVGCHEPYR